MMRGLLMSIAVLFVVGVAGPSRVMSAQAASVAPSTPAPAAVYALQIPDKKIEITVGDRDSSEWYRNPMWVAIGVLAAVVIVLLVLVGRRRTIR